MFYELVVGNDKMWGNVAAILGVSKSEEQPKVDDEAGVQVSKWKKANRDGGRRTPMGTYVPPDGQLPYTQLDGQPGPADYSPRVDPTKPQAPQYSISGKQRHQGEGDKPCPADYDTKQDLVWKRRTVTLKEKGRTYPYDVKPEKHVTCSLGPATYAVRSRETGSKGPKFGIQSRRPHGVNPGYPDLRVQPVDTHGFKTPGLSYRPNSRYWGRGPKPSMGQAIAQRFPDGPGPAEYTIMDVRYMPCYSLAKRLPDLTPVPGKEGPPPNNYDLGTTVGTGVSTSLRSRHNIKKKYYTPSPNTYAAREQWHLAPTAQLTYRWFEPKAETRPSPTDHTITKANCRKGPSYSMAKRMAPCWPDVLNYPSKVKGDVPGPGNYNLPSLLTNDGTAHSIGRRPASSKDDRPGPTHYNLPERPPHAKSAPRYSMGQRVYPPDKKVGPGPAAYSPRVPTGGAPKYSMGGRKKAAKKELTPGPDNYTVRKGQAARGTTLGPKVTLKGRPSPWIYSGFSNMARVQPDC
ncbi:uncharacterized protein [Branchiostoma lanceolatum]|uniref:uncharacterized protein n=1 Tax=Branchiostoma lanceolatum TaxID=7740 RepID=UPI003455BC2E